MPCQRQVESDPEFREGAVWIVRETAESIAPVAEDLVSTTDVGPLGQAEGRHHRGRTGSPTAPRAWLTVLVSQAT